MEKRTLKRELIIGIVLLIIGLGSCILAYMLNLDKSNSKAWYIYVLYILGAIIIFGGACFTYRFYQDNKDISKKINVREMTLIALQASISIILYYFVKFNLPFFPPWLDIQVSEIPALITSFIYGPSAGCLVIFIRFIVKLPGTITVGVGELADLILGFALVIISGVIYRKNKTLKGAFIGMSIGIVSSIILACILNYLVLIPAYINIAGFPLASLVKMMGYIPNVNENNFMFIYIFAGVLPFNILRYIIVFIFTFLLYKHIHFLFDRIAKTK